ncbi:MAG TPA: cytochrome c [Bacteroidota bacterium]|nr:cytochrome c [Bacteroidota bacterium]
MKTVLVTVVVVILVEAAFFVAGAYSGIPDIAATNRERGIMRWFLNTTKDHSISSRAAKIVPPPLGDSAMVKVGFSHYNEMCVTCHGAPGREADELAQGLNPYPPDLAYSTRDMSPSEMFVVVKDGIKMTGMPGFGPTHNDTLIWSMVAFLQRLQTMTPEEYRAFQKSVPDQMMEESHGHHGSEDD